MTHPNQYVADVALAARYSVSRNTIWRWTEKGELPQPLKLSPGCTRWRLSDVEAWEASRNKGAK
jgi:prophage regulatory protein